MKYEEINNTLYFDSDDDFYDWCVVPPRAKGGRYRLGHFQRACVAAVLRVILIYRSVECFSPVSLHQVSRLEATTSSKASFSIAGSCFPRFSALRRMPSAAFGLKKYFSGAFTSKIADKVHSLSTLGYSPVLSVIDTPGNAVAVSHDASGREPFEFVALSLRSRNMNSGFFDLTERLEDGLEVCSLVTAESSGDIFPDCESGVFSVCRISHLPYHSYCFEE